MCRSSLFVAIIVLLAGVSLSQAQTDSFKATARDKGILIEWPGLSAIASRLTYEGATGQLMLEGTADSPAVMRQTAGGRSSELSARRIIVSLKTGATKLEAIRFLEANPK